MDTPTDARGEEILADPTTPAEARAEHPDGLPDKAADQTPGAGIADAKANDAPIRTDRPDVPIVQSLGTGAGQHTPPDDPHVNTEGRYVPDPPAPGEDEDTAAPVS
jgi:hypothetical protein